MAIETGQLIKAEDINFNNGEGFGGQIVKIDSFKLTGNTTYTQNFTDIDFDYCEIRLGWPIIIVTKILKSEITRPSMLYSIQLNNVYFESYNQITSINQGQSISTNYLSVNLTDSILTITNSSSINSIYNVSVVYYINKQILKLDKPTLQYSKYSSDTNSSYTQNLNNLNFKYLEIYLDFPWTRIFSLSKNTTMDADATIGYYYVYYGASYYYLYKGFSVQAGYDAVNNGININYNDTNKNLTISLNSSGQNAGLKGLNIVYYK